MVSVIITNYNQEKFILKALDSALKQNVDMEIRIYDDCSKDNSMKVLEKYVDELREKGCEVPIHIMPLTKNRGVSALRNRGIMDAEGEYVAFLDSDDVWRSGKLVAEIKALEETGAPLVTTARSLIDENGKKLKDIIETKEIITLKDLKKTNLISMSSVCARTADLRKYFFTPGDFHEDYLLWLQMLKDYDCFVGINEPYLRYRVVKNSRSKNKLHAARMTFRTYKAAGYGWKVYPMMIVYAFKGIVKYKM